MINYNWNCRTVDVYPQSGEYANVVRSVRWVLTGTHEEVEELVIRRGVHTFEVDNIIDFIPFEELTNAQITEWVKDEMGSELVSQIEEEISNQINEMLNPPLVTKVIEL